MDLTKLVTALRANLGYETVKPTATDKQIRLLGRLPPNRMGDWLIFIHHLHVSWITARKAGWTMDISKLYFPLPPHNKIVFAWRLIFQSQDPTFGIEVHMDDILKAISAAPKSARGEVTAMPLVGSRAGMPMTADGKGAGFTDHTPVGPLAVSALRRG